MMGIIGFSVGIVGFLLHQIIDIISEFKWELTSHYIQVNILSLTIENLFAKKRKEKIMDWCALQTFMGFSIQKARGSGHLGLYFFLHFITNIPMYFPQTRGLTEFFICFSEARLLRSLRFHSWLLHHFCCCKLYSSSLPTSGSRLGDPRNYWLSERHQDKRHF